MATFPRTEPEIITLAQTMISGLEADEAYASPPVQLTTLTVTLQSFIGTRSAAATAQGAAEAAINAKNVQLDLLVAQMKKDLRYAEDVTNGDDAKLQKLGWGGKSAGKALVAPGQTLELAAPEQGEGSVQLTWGAPESGGMPAAYKVQRRERPAGPWADVGTALTCALALSDQTRNKELEYRVLAVNKAGEGGPSNTVLVVL